MKVTIKGTDYEVPPLSLNSLRKGATALIKRSDELIQAGITTAEANWDAFEVRGKVILMALQQDFKDLTEDDLFDALHMGNVNKIYNAVMGISMPGEDEPAPSEKTEPEALTTTNMT